MGLDNTGQLRIIVGVRALDKEQIKELSNEKAFQRIEDRITKLPEQSGKLLVSVKSGKIMHVAELVTKDKERVG